MGPRRPEREQAEALADVAGADAQREAAVVVVASSSSSWWSDSPAVVEEASSSWSSSPASSWWSPSSPVGAPSVIVRTGAGCSGSSSPSTVSSIQSVEPSSQVWMIFTGTSPGSSGAVKVTSKACSVSSGREPPAKVTIWPSTVAVKPSASTPEMPVAPPPPRKDPTTMF